MSNWRTRVISAALALSLLVPAAAFAGNAVTARKDIPVKKGFAYHQRLDGEQRQQNEQKLLEMVSKYTPEILGDWKNALAEREQLMGELKEKAPVHKQSPQLSAELKEKVEAIRKDVENGKLTPEQAREEFKKLGLGKEGPRRESYLPSADKEKQLMGEFRKAVEANDEARIKELLPQLLKQLQERNKGLSEMLSKTNQ
ncbi:hypothetical protein [Desulfofundulus thermosubterraneus]|uniref:LTXXQ motif family protein n=1 Tax=Desulfofundulus thermosubterraneus DSM 16057 TaxID=1121432 RepID=A0A1M6BZJ4_9FIRM|nr:hypothetical protein [Desulfofundulus thermosubterraneus]SHI54031.1 hypothetical protein SAMN02745219_00540 [Desulfofundulus thermosubterraneus DSM 16057]